MPRLIFTRKQTLKRKEKKIAKNFVSNTKRYIYLHSSFQCYGPIGFIPEDLQLLIAPLHPYIIRSPSTNSVSEVVPEPCELSSHKNNAMHYLGFTSPHLQQQQLFLTPRRRRRIVSKLCS
ncbi:uncharacterized protein A4U43_C03F22710 [Asparagus officinalis]|uniref:Uncharacterized protein n=1 Tax=Asparagus officinalis TaxID=4686 RepID=A0A5P1FD06_ASPOF|nr:uncharacterized protein A4U43_C03F22710 [Asparagus officinalis]